MNTVFSHIVQKRLSQEYENVATDALAFILESSERVRNGMMKLLRAVVPGLPPLRFDTQASAYPVETIGTKTGTIRPDMWGYDQTTPRVYVENKFWAGLTDNQPVAYLTQLAGYAQPTLLLFVVPELREQSVWRELASRITAAGMTMEKAAVTSSSVVHAERTSAGPILALTSWPRLLKILDAEIGDDFATRSNMQQLAALCDVAESDAFVPISASQVSDQRIPALLVQLSSIMRASVDLAVTEGVIDRKGVTGTKSWDSVGLYANLRAGTDYGVLICRDFDLWRRHGASPLWIVFASSEWGRAAAARPLIERWAAERGVFPASEGGDLAIPIPIAVNEDKDHVVRRVVDFLREVVGALAESPVA